MTERSNRDEERDIDFVLYEETCCIGSREFDQTARCGNRAHERQLMRSHAANLASTRQLAEPLEWKGQVTVLFDPGVVEGLTAMELG